MPSILFARSRSAQPFLLFFPAMMGVWAFALPAQAASSYYVSPTGSGSACSPDTPCALRTAEAAAQAGDFVVLTDGTYTAPIDPPHSGTANGWITFQAAPGALPIFDGTEQSMVDGGAATGLGSATATYLRFVGIVAQNWSSGFSNGWTGMGTTNSNGHFQYINCIADGNSRNGFVFNSAQGVLVQQCIVAHNGTSTTASWSSGVQLFEVQGTAQDNVVQQNVSFENVDFQNHTDGSGFIVDQMCTGASFINNIAFGNGGSCIRLTKSSNTVIANNTCYHNGLDPKDTGPSNPGEIYFTDAQSRTGVVVVNNLAAASGSTADGVAFVNPPTSGLANDFTINSGATPFFSDPAGTNPDFRLSASATSSATDKGTTMNAPATDIGFDPKCLKAGAPAGGPSFWKYSVDYTYIRSLGGVAGCFKPGTRPAGNAPDIGAYELNAVTAPVSPAPPLPPVGTGADGGAASGSSSGGGGGDAGAGTRSPDGAAASSSSGGNDAGRAGGGSGSSGGTAGGSGGSNGDADAATGMPGASSGGSSGSSGGGGSSNGGGSNAGGSTGGGSTSGSTAGASGTGGSSSSGSSSGDGAAPSGSAPGPGSAAGPSGGCSVAKGRTDHACAWVGLLLVPLLLRRRGRRARQAS